MDTAHGTVAHLVADGRRPDGLAFDPDSRSVARVRRITEFAERYSRNRGCEISTRLDVVLSGVALSRSH
jgi:hypothetical protein